MAEEVAKKRYQSDSCHRKKDESAIAVRKTFESEKRKTKFLQCPFCKK